MYVSKSSCSVYSFRKWAHALRVSTIEYIHKLSIKTTIIISLAGISPKLVGFKLGRNSNLVAVPLLQFKLNNVSSSSIVLPSTSMVSLTMFTEPYVPEIEKNSNEMEM